MFRIASLAVTGNVCCVAATALPAQGTENVMKCLWHQCALLCLLLYLVPDGFSNCTLLTVHVALSGMSDAHHYFVPILVTQHPCLLPFRHLWVHQQ